MYLLFLGMMQLFSALDFITQCEDAFSSVLVVQPKDKINFTRQQLPKNSTAFTLMKSVDFKEAYEREDYDAFKALFLSTFDDDKAQDIIKVLSASVDEIAKGLGSHDYRKATVPATKLTESAMRILKSAE